MAPHGIVIVDNASTDGTAEAIKGLAREDKRLTHLRLEENGGGAGGFHEGMRYISGLGKGWLWLMDDDALPELTALEYLIAEANNVTDIYGSIAVDNRPEGSSLCWPVVLLSENGSRQNIDNVHHMPPLTSSTGLPFLGFMIHTSLIDKIGLPEKEYFISGDDVEYSLRARDAGAKIFIISSSIIRHPLPARAEISFLGKKINVFSLEPWKQYYDTRNRILNAKKYFGLKLWTQTLPKVFLCWLYALFVQNQRVKQSKAFSKGIVDGLLDRRGIRWIPEK